MDTAMITFMIQTPPSTESVHLIGSWDDFTKRYRMERDDRRARGQWRGLYSFENIMYDRNKGSSSRRTGGLKMGTTYYYYYELDHGAEYHDPSIPFTTSCPYLPGQPVNFLWVPIEVQPLRKRSASMSSMASGNIRTMNPADKFITPRAAPAFTTWRLSTSTSALIKKRSIPPLLPKLEISKWSSNIFPGLRSHGIASSEDVFDTNERSFLSKRSQNNFSACGSGRVQKITTGDDLPVARSSPRSHARPIFPLPLSQENFALSPSLTTFHRDQMMTPNQVDEKAENNRNFASLLNCLLPLNKRGIRTSIAPTIDCRPLLRQLRTAEETSKPRPQFPEKAVRMLQHRFRYGCTTVAPDPPSLNLSMPPTAVRICTSPSKNLSGEPFHFVDEEGSTVNINSGDDLASSPVLSQASMWGLGDCSLLDTGYTSTKPLLKASRTQVLEAKDQAKFSATQFSPAASSTVESMTALEQLVSEMAYLGDIIIG